MHRTTAKNVQVPKDEYPENNNSIEEKNEQKEKPKMEIKVQTFIGMW